MLSNYFKIAIAVLKRRKFFTFISLFGISFTLTILIVITSFIDHLVDPGYPDANRNRSLYVQRMELSDPKKGWSRSGPVSFHFYDKYVRSLQKPELVSFQSMPSPTVTYINNRKLSLDVKYVNADFWNVYAFSFIEGKPFSAEQLARGEKLAVITDKTSADYFGTTQGVTGKTITTDNEDYTVAGVVKAGPITDIPSYGELYLPYTLMKGDYKGAGLNGSFLLTLLARSENEVNAVKEEYAAMVKRIPPQDKEYTKISSEADPFLASFARPIMGGDHSDGMTKLTGLVVAFFLLFLLLPTINLVNINVSRIMERSSEIAVRKAFGASSRTLAVQFIVENLILTFIGGILGLLFSLLVISIINTTELIPGGVLTMNYKVLGLSFVICMIFGLLSGVYPAWRMSKLQVVRALKMAQ